MRRAMSVLFLNPCSRQYESKRSNSSAGRMTVILVFFRSTVFEPYSTAIVRTFQYAYVLVQRFRKVLVAGWAAR